MLPVRSLTGAVLRHRSRTTVMGAASLVATAVTVTLVGSGSHGTRTTARTNAAPVSSVAVSTAPSTAAPSRAATHSTPPRHRSGIDRVAAAAAPARAYVAGSPATTPTPTPAVPAVAVPTTVPTAAPPAAVTMPDNSAAQAVFSSLNATRSQAGLPALQWSSGLQASAHQHNLAMAAANQLSHRLPGEADLGSRISAQGVGWQWAAENIGETSEPSTAGVLSLESYMVAEKPPNDGHRQNILSTRARQVGIDVVIDQANHRLWLTEDFAQS